jgi:hypothetical protein
VILDGRRHPNLEAEIATYNRDEASGQFIESRVPIVLASLLLAIAQLVYQIRCYWNAMANWH